MSKKVALETFTLKEISGIFQESLKIALPKSKGAIAHKLKQFKKIGISNSKWIKTYEEFKGAKLSFYCEKIPTESQPIVSIGMTHRTSNGLLLVTADTSNGGISPTGFVQNSSWNKWVRIYTGHFCKRFAERILKSENSTFQIGSKGIMFSDMQGPVRVTDTIAEGVDEIEFQFKEGQAYGYRDNNNKITYFRTTYSNDMLKHDRLEFRKEWEQPLEELYELFKWKK
ncbi:hypothetical protein GCM10011344_36290 [Dokdonia pacifica]|uniref:Uncharacterized protein n=1 Tax=Dokdonia pacifica TaxID=1627892 RepID=A0A239AWI2_9FLAO|nr:hypothetical protein [Dokdonia pacifica]GGG32125.1 hypothetical protein GCM10011344_36290 [Dokdonia pacifica]SNR99869.1 hypothetical protein SAMN06265376_105176 [Dokdonia pacifica]